MTKFLACLLVLASGCPDVKTDPGEGPGEGTTGPIVEFDPSNAILPFPNNLVLCATGSDAAGAPCTIGKVAIPAPACETPAAKAIRTTTLNQLDGFGTFEAAMQITLSTAVDPTTLDGHIVMYQRTHGAAAIDPAGAMPVPVKLIPATTLRFTEGKCTSPATVDAVTIVPLVPLEQKSTYTLAVVPGIKTSDGKDYAPSSTWALIRSKTDPVTVDTGGSITANRTPLVPGGDANGNGVPDTQELVGLDQVWKAHVAAFTFLAGVGVTREQTLVAWDYTTQTVTDPLDPSVAGSPASAVAASTTGFLGLQSVVCDVGPTCPNGYDRTAEPYASCAAGDSNTLCFLEISLAVGSGVTGTPAQIYAAGNQICQQVGCAAIGDVLGGVIISTQYQQPLPNPLAGGKPIPGAWSDPIAPTDQGGEQLQALVFIPASPAPAGGWPTVVFGHGLTSSKSALAALAPQLAASPEHFASIAIDFVDHGSRAIKITNDGACATENDASANPECFQPVISADLGQTRDNVRQTILDLQRVVHVTKYCGTHLCTSVTAGGSSATPSTFKVDPAHIVYTGQSLGGIIGTTTSATSPDIVTAVLDVPAVGLVDVLEHTDTLEIRCQLVDALIDAGVIVGDKSTSATPLCANEDWQAQPGYQQFAGIARWVLDPADGANFMSRLVTKKFLIQEVVGDEVVPNYATDIEGALAGLTPQTADPATSAPPPASAAITTNPSSSKWVRYPTLPPAGMFPGNTFAHASLLRPANGGPDGTLGTVRLQSDAITFLVLNH
jgi:pimeloyl-ACP methyl ester carboxylesterase